MKSFYLRAGAALACAVALTACGGDDGQLVLGGYMTGITKSGLVLTNNGGSDFAVPAPTNGSGQGQFTFPNLISTDDRYNVEVKAMPSNVEKCDVYYGGGRAAYHITNVSVVCELKTHGLSGSISNLNGNLILVNGSDRVELTPGAGSFALAEIAEDSPYTVSVLQQPAGQTCAVSNGTGIMGTAPVANVAVTCTP